MSVDVLVDKIQRGELRLPEMQRRYVWQKTRVRDLFDSLYRGYPSGAILVWETDEEVPLQDMAVSQAAGSRRARLLLDGQQRLTSLSAVIRGEPVYVRGRARPIELLFNLDHPDHLAVVTEVDEAPVDDAESEEATGDETEEEGGRIEDEADSTDDELQRRFSRMTFVVSTNKLAQMPNWVRVSAVFQTNDDRPFLRRAGVTDFDDPRYDRYSQRLARLRDIRRYVYRIDVLGGTLGYDEVTEIFVRVNSLGAKLRSSDLALAQITAKWRNSLETFEAFQKECTLKGFDLDLGLHLKNLIVFTTGQSRFLTVGKQPVDKLKQGWDEARRGMEFAINFLRQNVGIDSPALLSSPFLLITIGLFGHRRDYALSPDEARSLRYWARIANAKGRYSRGSSETLLDQDLSSIRSGEGVEALVDRLRQQVGRLDIVPEELEGRNQRSALFKTMFLAFRAAGARDWHSQVGLALDHSGAEHKLQFHHVFPKALLRGHVGPRDADDIANLAFIAGRTNRKISDSAPGLYVPKTVAQAGQGAFDAQCIPTDAALLEVEAYRDFLHERRSRIADRLNAYVSEA